MMSRSSGISSSYVNKSSNTSGKTIKKERLSIENGQQQQQPHGGVIMDNLELPLVSDSNVVGDTSSSTSSLSNNVVAGNGGVVSDESSSIVIDSGLASNNEEIVSDCEHHQQQQVF